MDESTLLDRRRFLTGVGIGSTTLVAGCQDQLGANTDTSAAQSDDEASSTVEVAAIVAIDQEALQEEQAAIQEDLQNEDINQTEAQEQMAEIQETYVGEGIDALKETVSEAANVEALETHESLGAVTVDGEPAAILGLLEADSVSALVSTAEVESTTPSQPSG
ncbi:MAG: hypothetical protein ACOCQY_04480 [Halorhabdus sp.]